MQHAEGTSLFSPGRAAYRKLRVEEVEDGLGEAVSAWRLTFTSVRVREQKSMSIERGMVDD